MYKKQIGHVIMVSMKFFFDFDYTICNHFISMALIIPCMAKLFLSDVKIAFAEGLLTVKEDYLTNMDILKQIIAIIKERLDNSYFAEALINNIQGLKTYLQEKDIRNWRLK